MKRTLAKTLLPAMAYFAIVFTVGAIIGPVRDLALSPLIGKLAAVLCELPIMIATSALAAARIVRRWPDVAPAAIGALSLAILLGVEAAGAVWLRGMSIQAYLKHLSDPDGIASLVMFGAFAIMPVAAAAWRRRLH